MKTTKPNIETVRRISMLCKVNYCYLLIRPNDPIIQLLADINDTSVKNYKSELEAWCGMQFSIYNESDKPDIIDYIIKNGKKILPIQHQEIKKAEKNLGL